MPFVVFVDNLYGMDLSKLPKLSNTPAAEQPAVDAPAPAPKHPVDYYPDPRAAGVGVEVWISVVLGVLFLFMGMAFARFALAKLTGQPFHTGVDWVAGPNAGSEVGYFDLWGGTAWTDTGIFLFGLTLLFEAAAKAAVALRPGTASRALLMVAIPLTLFAVVLNVYVCGKMLQMQITPLASGLAVAFGGWILYDEWQSLARTAPRPAR